MSIDKIVDKFNRENGWEFLEQIVERVDLIRKTEGYCYSLAEVIFVDNLFEGIRVYFIVKLGMSRKLATALANSHKKALAVRVDKLESANLPTDPQTESIIGVL